MSLNGRHYENDSVLPLSNTEYFNYLYVFVVSSLRLFLILGWKHHQKKKKVKFLKCSFLIIQFPKFADVVRSLLWSLWPLDQFVDTLFSCYFSLLSLTQWHTWNISWSVLEAEYFFLLKSYLCWRCPWILILCFEKVFKHQGITQLQQTQVTKTLHFGEDFDGNVCYPYENSQPAFLFSFILMTYIY